MASKDITQYKDLTPAQPLDKKTLNRMAWRSCQLQAAFNYERMQSAGWLWGILPGLQKIHTNKEDLAASMTHNMEFINTHPFLVTFVMGIVLSMEQQKSEIPTIRAVRISTAGPLGGIGDALFWMTLIPIVAGITANMAITDKSLIGPILYFVIAFGVEMALRFGLLHWSYNMGTQAVSMMTKNAKEFTRAASMLGVFVVGALTANYGATTLGIIVPNGQTAVEVEKLVIADGAIATEKVTEMQDVNLVIQDYLNSILPQLIPLAFTLLCFFLIKKKGFTPTKCIMMFLIIGIVGCAFGIWGGQGSYTPLVPVPWTVG